MAGWNRDTGEDHIVDPVPPGHGEKAPAHAEPGQLFCRCGMRLERDGTCPIHGTKTTQQRREESK